jgi:hypothetical protein
LLDPVSVALEYGIKGYTFGLFSVI